MKYDEAWLDHYQAQIETKLSLFLSKDNQSLALFKICAFLHMNQNDGQVVKAYSEKMLRDMGQKDYQYHSDLIEEARELGLKVDDDHVFSFYELAKILEASHKPDLNGRIGNGKEETQSS